MDNLYIVFNIFICILYFKSCLISYKARFLLFVLFSKMIIKIAAFRDWIVYNYSVSFFISYTYSFEYFFVRIRNINLWNAEKIEKNDAIFVSKANKI